MRWLVLDVATAAIPDAEMYLDGAIHAPSTYKDPEKIAAYVAEKRAERIQSAGLDIDLARVTGIGLMWAGIPANVLTCPDEYTEKAILDRLAREIVAGQGARLITYGGFNFDLPLVQRRARYLGVTFPAINTDRFKSPHSDLCELLSDRNPQRRRPLGFYVKRLGWTDLSKPLSGSEESRVHETGQWTDLADSICHDVTATARLAVWLGVIPSAKPEAVSA